LPAQWWLPLQRGHLTLTDAVDFNSPSGKGITGKVDGRSLAIGNRRLLVDHAIAADRLEAAAHQLGEHGATPVYVAIDGEPSGLIGIADPLKAGASEAVQALRGAGIRIDMLTGDTRATAEAPPAAQLGITEVHAEVLPGDKSAIVERLRREGRVVGIVGDGANDAPALAAADIGIAMGTGTDVAIESAGVCAVTTAVAGDDAQHSAKPGLCLRVQCSGRADRSGRTLSSLRSPSVAHRRRRHGLVVF
jgi:P-type Cu+ transporter